MSQPTEEDSSDAILLLALLVAAGAGLLSTAFLETRAAWGVALITFVVAVFGFAALDANAAKVLNWDKDKTP